MDNLKLAPSRIANSDWKEIKNNSTEPAYLTASYSSNLSGGGNGASLDMYKSAAIIHFGNIDEDKKNRWQEFLEQYLNNGEITGFPTDLLNDEFFILDGSENDAQVLSSIENALQVRDNVTVLKTGGPGEWTPACENKNPPWWCEGLVKPDPTNPEIPVEPEVPVTPTGMLFTKLLNNGKNIHLLYGVKLLEDAGNEYQAATLSVNFDFLLEQVEKFELENE